MPQALVTIGTTPLPAPSEYGLPQEDVGEIYYDELGGAHRDRVRQGRLRVPLGWSHATDDEVVTIKTAVAPATFQATFYVPGGTALTKTMMCEGIDIDIVNYHGQARWQVRLVLIEQ